jgi:hypothetical protein
MMRNWYRVLWTFVLMATLGAAGCGGQRASLSMGPVHAGVAPVLVVERFLNAVNTSDLDTMARLFGTRDGSILKRDRPAEVETRMYALASILRHKNYVMEGDGIVPGRLGEAIELSVRLEVDDREVTVPFVVVRTKRDGWMIEQIAIERITAGR